MSPEQKTADLDSQIAEEEKRREEREARDAKRKEDAKSQGDNPQPNASSPSSKGPRSADPADRAAARRNWMLNNTTPVQRHRACSTCRT